MSVAFTFGSLGDIIALSQIAIRLGRALASNGTGSSQQYKDLREELSVFTRVLMQVIEAYQQHQPTPFLTSLDATTKAVVDDCGCLMQDILEVLSPRYDQSLGYAGSGHRIKGFFKKIEWLLRETERVEKLREKLHRNSQLLGMLISIATRQSARVDNCTLLERITEVHGLVTEQVHRNDATPSTILENALWQQRRLELIETNLDAQKCHNDSFISVVRNGFCDVADLKRMVTEIGNTSISQQISASNSQYLRSLDPTREMPIWFEDALGCILTLPTEWVSDWRSLFLLIEGRFQGRVGKDMVLRKLYVLEEDRSGRDLDDSQPLTASLRRGMKINMAMVFVNADIMSGFCPRCHVQADAPEVTPEVTTFQCPKLGCGMWFKLEKITRPKVGCFLDGRRSDTDEGPSLLSTPSEFHRVRLRIDEASEEPILDYGNNEVPTGDNNFESPKPNPVDPTRDFPQPEPAKDATTDITAALNSRVTASKREEVYSGRLHCKVWAVASPTKPIGSTRSADSSCWRWGCCNCGFDNMSYLYNLHCVFCNHYRCLLVE